jgi:hypothetical protein
MKILYRRMSGKIGVTDQEVGTRGLWLEKRKALLSLLEARGHTVHRASLPTKESVGQFECRYEPPYDLLFIEFGSSNAQFYGEDLKKTVKFVSEHKGQIIFLNDDPDLPYLWDTVEEPKRWAVWANAITPQPFGGQPREVRMYDFPFSSLQNSLKPSRQYQKDALVYLGRPIGRKQMVQSLFAFGAPWRIHGKPKEWAEFGVEVYEPPTQSARADFYNRQIGCLALADAKHKLLGWRTGRAYHAVLAGCPVLAEADHPALRIFSTFRHVKEVREWYERMKDDVSRETVWAAQLEMIRSERQVIDATLKRFQL